MLKEKTRRDRRRAADEGHWEEQWFAKRIGGDEWVLRPVRTTPLPPSDMRRLEATQQELDFIPADLTKEEREFFDRQLDLDYDDEVGRYEAEHANLPPLPDASDYTPIPSTRLYGDPNTIIDLLHSGVAICDILWSS